MTSKISRAVLSDAETNALIQRNCWGVLALSDGDEPYAVPVMYGYDGRSFVFINGPGHKLDLLRANGRVCLVITEVIDSGRSWSSALVRGAIEWLTGQAERAAALELLRRQIPFTPARLNDQAATAQAPLARIIPGSITGRTGAN